MKKAFIGILILVSLTANAQTKDKVDTTIQVTLDIDQYRALLYAIDSNIDSKKVSKEIVEFIAKSAKMVADKPKSEITAKPKN